MFRVGADIPWASLSGFRTSTQQAMAARNLARWEVQHREETQRWAARLGEIIDGDPQSENLDVIAEF